MPFGDGTGPRGQGPGTGRGRGGAGMGAGGGRGRMGGTRPGAGPGGDCLCPSCGARATHRVGVPCNESKCPKCGTPMVRG